MTAMHDTNPDPLTLFLRALPPRLRNRVTRTGRLYTLVHAAVIDHGWTPQALAAECARNQDRAVVNPGGIVMHRLEQAAAHGPDEPAAPKVHDGCCESGWIYDETTIPPTVTKCPGKATP